MQVSATLIAAQQAAREARTRLQLPQGQSAEFTAALQKAGVATDGFAPLPLKQAAQTAASAQPQPGARMGMHLDITV